MKNSIKDLYSIAYPNSNVVQADLSELMKIRRYKKFSRSKTLELLEEHAGYINVNRQVESFVRNIENIVTMVETVEFL